MEGDIMYKFIFEIITDPLGLPISVIQAKGTVRNH
jgi:hypothetical protein